MAKEDKQKDNENQDQPEQKSMMGKLIVGAIVGAIVLTETVAVWMMLPDPKSIADDVRAEIRAKAAENGVGEEDILDLEDVGPLVEVELGDFNVSIHQPASNTSLYVNCKIMGCVKEDDQGAFESVLASTQNRLRERILVELRSADPADIAEPGLGLIKRRILEKSNRLFEKPYLRSIVISEYNYFSQ